MYKIYLIIILFHINGLIFAQYAAKDYFKIIEQADSLSQQKKFLNAAKKYAEAFQFVDSRAIFNDRNQAACNWARVGLNDSAFEQLYWLLKFSETDILSFLKTDTCMICLHGDSRWFILLDTLMKIRMDNSCRFNIEIINILDTILINDQQFRKQWNVVIERFGMESVEMQSLFNITAYHDSINVRKVSAIIDKYGWLGEDEVGKQGNRTLFLVLQHASIDIQLKYLSLLRESFKSGKLKGRHLALFEDRVAWQCGKSQIYGSQISQDANGNYVVIPLIDPINVNERRRQLGLGAIEEYLKNWNITWDVENYLKILPELKLRFMIKD